jgi:hypothetical protein
MAATTDEIVVKFSTSGSEEIVNTFKKTADASDQFHQKVSKAGGALGDLRLKSEGRVANNIGAIAQALVGGASAGEVFATAITKATESFRGSLLFAGAATVGFALYEGITKAGEAVIALETKIADLKRSTSVSGDFVGADLVAKNLDTALTTFDELRAKFVKEHAGLGGYYDRAARGLLTFSTGGEVESQDTINIAKARQSILGALSQTAEKQKTLNDITREGLNGDERKAVLHKITADHDERAARIAAAEVKVGIIGGGKAQREETNRLELEKSKGNKPFDLLEKGVELQARIIDTEKELRAPADENLKILDARIAGVQDLLDHQHNLTDQEREQLLLQRGQLEATKERAQFARQLESDLAGIELGRVRGAVGSDRSRINSAQRGADQAAVYGTDSPEYQRAEAGLDDEQFRQFEDYEKNPGAFRQRRINEQFQRKRFQYLRNSGQLPDDIKSNPHNVRVQQESNPVVGGLLELIKTLNALPARIGVG